MQISRYQKNKSLRKLLIAGVLAGSAGAISVIGSISPASADETDGSAWLGKIASAAHRQNYNGVFVHQRGSLMDSLRVVHMADADGETVKLETLDGVPRKMIRHNKTGYCLVPGNNPLVQESGGRRRIFPALLPEKSDSLLAYYRVKLKDVDRVAGQPCQVVVLEPKDQYRYGYSFCAAIPGGLMLRANLLAGQPDTNDGFVFSELSLDTPNEAARKALNDEWQTQSQHSSPPPKPLPTETHWTVTAPPDGYQLISAVLRPMPGRTLPVSHLVYSDGLATVSVFIEMPRKDMQPTTRPVRNGVTSVYMQNRFQHQITAMGEVPAATLMQFVNTVEPK